MIRVLLADDHPVVRAGLRAVLGTADDVEVVGEAATPSAAAELAGTLRPDLVLMDLQFAGDPLTGADATRRIRALDPAPPVLVLTNYDTEGDILGAIEAGASGYLLKDAPPDRLLAAIRDAAAGRSALAPAVADRLLARVRAPRVRLTAREIEVLTLVADGVTNAGIAAALHLSAATVKSHLVHVFTKLGASSRTAAVSAARELGILR